MAANTGWVGGPSFIMIKRGSNIGRSGGAHSGGAMKAGRKRTVATVTRALHANFRVKRKG